VAVAGDSKLRPRRPEVPITFEPPVLI